VTGNAPLKILNGCLTIFPNGVKKSTGDLAKPVFTGLVARFVLVFISPSFGFAIKPVSSVDCE
jgi:hypothetical protein